MLLAHLDANRLPHTSLKVRTLGILLKDALSGYGLYHNCTWRIEAHTWIGGS